MFACVGRFLPPVCKDHIPVRLLEEDGQKKKVAYKGPMEISFSDWLLGWDNYGIGAAILKQLTYQSALAHKHVVISIARSGKKDDRLAVVYDHLIRYTPCSSHS